MGCFWNVFECKSCILFTFHLVNSTVMRTKDQQTIINITLIACKTISSFHIHICSETLWVNTESGAREKAFELTLHTAHKCLQVKLDSLDIGGMWADCSNMNKATVWASAAVFLSAQLSGEGAASTVYFVFLTHIQQLCRYFLVIQGCRKSGKYTPPPQKGEKEVRPLWKQEASLYFFFNFISHIYYDVWFFSPLSDLKPMPRLLELKQNL